LGKFIFSFRSLIVKLEQEKSSLQTKLEDQYREKANRDKQIEEIGLQVRRFYLMKRDWMTSSEHILFYKKRLDLKWIDWT
jgi:hypothetical protein